MRAEGRVERLPEEDSLAVLSRSSAAEPARRLGLTAVPTAGRPGGARPRLPRGRGTLRRRGHPAAAALGRLPPDPACDGALAGAPEPAARSGPLRPRRPRLVARPAGPVAGDNARVEATRASSDAAFGGSSASLRLGRNCRQRVTHGGLPAQGDAPPPPAAERPEVCAELAGVLELGSLRRLAQLEPLDDVRHAAANQAEVDALRAARSGRSRSSSSSAGRPWCSGRRAPSPRCARAHGACARARAACGRGRGLRSRRRRRRAPRGCGRPAGRAGGWSDRRRDRQSANRGRRARRPRPRSQGSERASDAHEAVSSRRRRERALRVEPASVPEQVALRALQPCCRTCCITCSGR